MRAHWERRIILRASLIYGPRPPAPVERPLFLQFVEEALREGRPTKFLTDEFRCGAWAGFVCVGACVGWRGRLTDSAHHHHHDHHHHRIATVITINTPKHP